MDRISLLPPEIKEIRKSRQKQSKIFFLVVIFIIVVVAANLFFIVSAYFIRENLKTLQGEREIVDNQAASLLEYEQLYNKLLRSEILVSDAMGSVPRWGNLLHDLAQTLPVGSQIADLRLSYSNQSGTLAMRGSNFNYRNQAAMLEQLYTMEQLDQVNIQSSTIAAVGGRDVVQFVINSVLLTGPDFLADHQGGEDE